ncbi:MAG: acyltransferase family protein [Acidimicrobiales bacterium]
MTKPSTPDVFRADIQGLRAIAVLAVLFYHLDVTGFSGGYVGVDVFFVISGFLITGHLARDAEDRRFSASRFYSRRVRRLLPLSALVFVATLVATWFLASPYRARMSSGEGVWVTLFASNMYFLRQQTDYFAATTTPSTFQHYWSLAVEEQFYLVWPWLYLATRWLARRFGRANSTGASGILVVMAASFAYAVWLMERSQPMAFYLLPARAWELGAGGILALSYKRRANVAVANGALALGVAGIATSVLLYNETTKFPGITAVLPVASTVLCLAYGESAGIDNPIAAALRSSPAQTIGRLSYSIYLWHWPMVVLAGPAGFELDRWSTVVGITCAAFVLSYCTERWVERRFRFARPSRSGAQPTTALPMFVGIVGSCLALLVAGAAAFDSGRFAAGEAAPIIASGELPDAIAEQALYSLPSNLYPPLPQARQIVPSIWSRGCQQEIGFYDPTPCVVGERGERGERLVVAIVGDSHMAMWEPSIEQLADSGQITILSYSKSACSPTTYRSTPRRTASRSPTVGCARGRL